MSIRHDQKPSAPLPLKASAFGLKRGKVKLVQTHIGWVYLYGKFAFKLKKHVKFDFLDFTTLKGRCWACAREISLNRRLCPDLYIGLCPVLRDRRGRVRVASELVLRNPHKQFKTPRGERVVDWAVWMKRMPEPRMLNRLLDNGRATNGDAERIADVLAEFYLRQRKEQDMPSVARGALKSIVFNINENLSEGREIDRKLLSAGALKLIEVRARGFLKRHRVVIEQRIRSGFVLDCHGDLRAENVCLPENAPPLLFDCIEFNDRFRICDTALDAAFLAMDFDSHQRHDLSAAFLLRYMQRCDQKLSPALLNFYLGYRAFVKAKVAGWISADKNVAEPQRRASEIQARMLFDLGVRYALQRRRVLLVFCGVSGSGKSSLAAHLAARLNCAHLATDIVRDEVVPRGAPVAQRYSSAASGRVYELLYQRARKLLREEDFVPPATGGVPSPVVILDGTFMSASSRKRAAETARECGACSVLVRAESSPEAIAAHFKQRNRSRNFFGSEARLQISLSQQAKFEAPRGREGFDAQCRIDTRGDLESSKAAAWDGVLTALSKILK